MITRIFFLFFCCCSFINFSQTQNEIVIDSLKKVLIEDKSGIDPYLGTLNELAYEYHFQNPEVGARYADSAIAISKKYDKEKILATAFNRKATNLTALSKYAGAQKYYDSSLVLNQKYNLEKEVGKIYFNKGINYFEMSEMALAIDSYKRAYDIFKINNDFRLMAVALNSIGIVSMNLTDYPEAIKSFNEALLILEGKSQHTSFQYGNILNNLGLVYSKVEENNPSFALDYYERARILFEKEGYLAGEGDTLINEGNLFDNNGQGKDALIKYEEALKIFEEIRSDKRIIGAKTNIAIVQNKLGMYKEAEFILNEAILFYKLISDERNLIIAHEALGENNLYRENFNTSILQFQKALSLSRKISNLRYESNSLSNLSKTYVAIRDFEKAYKYKDSASKVIEEYRSLENEKKIVQQQEQYKYNSKRILEEAQYNKEKAILVEQAKREKQIRNLIALSAIIIFLLIATIFHLNRKKEKVTYAKNKAQLELTTSKAQLNPHFIFNSLTAIDNFVAEEKAEEASEYLKEFAAVIRKGLENTENETIFLNEEISFLSQYLDIEQLRKDFRYKISVGEGIDINKIKIPPLLLQPLIENSIQHAQPNKREQLKINVIFHVKNDELHCEVNDNGLQQGYSVIEKMVTSKSYGFKLTKERVEALNYLKKSKNPINLKVTPSEMSTQLIIPIES